MSKIDEIGNKINKNWIEFLDESKNELLEALQKLPKYEEHEELPNLYIIIDQKNLDIEYGGIMQSDYFQGVSHSEWWYVPIMVDSNTTIEELKDIDLAEETYYFEDLED